MKERKPQPSPVEVLFRRRHERAGWFWADAMRAMERNAEKKKHDLKSGGATCLWRRPLGMEGASIRGGRGTLGLQTRLFSFQAERRSWREGCLRTGAVTARTSAKVRISSQRDREAAGWDTRRSYISMNRVIFLRKRGQVKRSAWLMFN
jgi:hypothetical protein